MSKKLISIVSTQSHLGERMIGMLKANSKCSTSNRLPHAKILKTMIVPNGFCDDRSDRKKTKR